MTSSTVQLGVRVPPGLLAQLKAEHRRSYPEHGLSFNRWLCALLEAAAYPEE